jgi:conjugal transfer pilin signal peptidase TrbI
MASTALPSVPRRTRLPRWRTLLALSAACLAWAALHDWAQRHAFLINATDSLPNWAFFVDKGVLPVRGQYIFFRVPQTQLIKSHFGEHPGAFGKLVYGVTGDLVTRAGSIVSVNGSPVARLKPLTKTGEALTPGPLGRVPSGCYFAASPHKDGFDSRYADIGWVCGKQVVGTGVSIL